MASALWFLQVANGVPWLADDAAWERASRDAASSSCGGVRAIQSAVTRDGRDVSITFNPHLSSMGLVSDSHLGSHN